MSAPQRTARIEDEIWDPAQERAKTEGASLAALMRAAVQAYAADDLTSQALPASQPGRKLTSQQRPASQPAAAAITVPAGEPSPSVACSGPGCWNRDTARYGLRRLVLCTACAAALRGETYQRPLSPSAARIIGGTAA